MDDGTDLFQLTYHPVSLVLPSTVGDDEITDISCTGSLSKAGFRDWLVHLGRRIHIPDTASVTYRISTGKAGLPPAMKGVFHTAGGLSIIFNTDSDFIDTADASGTVINRSVLAEPFPKGYKILYDQTYGGR